jgi:hypothetical protein
MEYQNARRLPGRARTLSALNDVAKSAQRAKSSSTRDLLAEAR